MSGTAKRQATSPADKIPNNKKSMQGITKKASGSGSDPSKGSLVKFEVVSINDKPFYGSFTEAEILYVWEKILGRSKDEMFAMSYNRSLTRNFRVTYKLTTQIETSAFYPEPTFEYHRSKPEATSEDDFDIFQCRFVGYSNVKPAELGQLTRITVKTNDFAVEPHQITPWLAKFGSVSSNFDYERNSLGIRTDIFETEILLKKHIPEYLPIAGRKVVVSYPGIPRFCNNCFQGGHLKRTCKLKKKEWLERVNEMRSTGDFEDDMFGGWIAILDQIA